MIDILQSIRWPPGLIPSPLKCWQTIWSGRRRNQAKGYSLPPFIVSAIRFQRAQEMEHWRDNLTDPGVSLPPSCISLSASLSPIRAHEGRRKTWIWNPLPTSCRWCLWLELQRICGDWSHSRWNHRHSILFWSLFADESDFFRWVSTGFEWGSPLKARPHCDLATRKSLSICSHTMWQWLLHLEQRGGLN